MVTPGIIATPSPIQTLFPIETGLLVNGRFSGGAAKSEVVILPWKWSNIVTRLATKT